jgi:hypothetical protein
MCAACTGTHCKGRGKRPVRGAGCCAAPPPYRNAPLAGSNFVVDFSRNFLIHLHKKLKYLKKIASASNFLKYEAAFYF